MKGHETNRPVRRARAARRRPRLRPRAGPPVRHRAAERLAARGHRRGPGDALYSGRSPTGRVVRRRRADRRTHARSSRPSGTRGDRPQDAPRPAVRRRRQRQGRLRLRRVEPARPSRRTRSPSRRRSSTTSWSPRARRTSPTPAPRLYRRPVDATARPATCATVPSPATCEYDDDAGTSTPTGSPRRRTAAG